MKKTANPALTPREQGPYQNAITPVKKDKEDNIIYVKNDTGGPNSPNKFAPAKIVDEDDSSITIVLPGNAGKTTIPRDKVITNKEGKKYYKYPIKENAPLGFDSKFTKSPAQQEMINIQLQTTKAKEVYDMKHQADKRDNDGVRTKDNFDDMSKPREFNKHEDVCQPNKSVCPCTKERENIVKKTFVGTAKTEQDIKVSKTQMTQQQEQIIKTPFNPALTATAKKDLMEKTAMYDAVYMMPGKCQWCPKLRNAVSMHTCATVCPEGRRMPQIKEGETYTDYLLKGGSDEGEVKCGLKQWMELEMDRYYPGWLEDHIKQAGGEVVGSETNFGNRRMNLDKDERRHMPRYPEEKLIEKVMERERHHYDANDTKLASNSAKMIKSAGGCDQCNMVRINGIPCHEQGCPNQEHKCKCDICGYDFNSKNKYTRICPDCKDSEE
jgi:hypothetical protein